MDEPVVVWGAGAIGGTIGAHLLRAGRRVVLVDVVPEHVEAMRARGLAVEGPVARFTVPAPEAVTPEGLRGRHRLVLLAVKAHHTDQATRALAPFLAEDGAVVSCQNGLNELAIADIVGRPRTIGAFVNFGADYHGPGRILFGNRGAVVVGELDGRRTPRIEALHALLRLFDPDAVLTGNIFGYLWGKAAYGAILKASALTNDSIAGFMEDPARRPLVIGIAREVLRVAAAEGVAPIGFDGFDPAAFARGDAAGIAASLDRLIAHNRASAKSHSGVWRDLAVRRRQTDVGAQLAPVRAAARRHGIATPLADGLVALVGEVEAGRREIDGALADALGRLVPAEERAA
jgi:2-dehydropantoate 2-reductase